MKLSYCRCSTKCWNGICSCIRTGLFETDNSKSWMSSDHQIHGKLLRGKGNDLASRKACLARKTTKTTVHQDQYHKSSLMLRVESRLSQGIGWGPDYTTW